MTLDNVEKKETQKLLEEAKVDKIYALMESNLVAGPSYPVLTGLLFPHQDGYGVRFFSKCREVVCAGLIPLYENTLPAGYGFSNNAGLNVVGLKELRSVLNNDGTHSKLLCSISAWRFKETTPEVCDKRLRYFMERLNEFEEWIGISKE